MSKIDVTRDELQVALWQSAFHAEFSDSDLSRIQRALSGDDVPTKVVAMRTIVRRGRWISEFNEERHLAKTFLNMVLPDVQHEKLALRAAAVAAVGVLEPEHPALSFVEGEDDPWVKLAPQYQEEDIEMKALNQFVLAVMGQTPHSEWWSRAVTFASTYAPHPGWREFADITLTADGSMVETWLADLLNKTSISEHVDGLSFNYGYSSDVTPVFELTMSGQEFVDYDQIFSSADHVGGCKPEVLLRLEELFPSSSQDPIVCAIRHLCLASIVVQACNKHRQELLALGSEIALGISYGSCSFVPIGSITTDGWES